MASEPLTVEDLFGSPSPEHPYYENVVEDVYGDGIEMLIGHVDADEIDRRIRMQPWWRPGLTIAAAPEHAWVTFDVHAPSCDASDPAMPGTDCRCSWQPWIIYHWREALPDAPGAVAVTFVQLAQQTVAV
ncbi:hypothetical protein [Actinopolymorpha pittospori]|uniref:Uncharacterized protein n=1 Tax=Actinopolymorpha pittospori TaxID=648752 RepID=A0A927MN48_9ACTN|nr:hypothetical protein [Actinopolymorpha pittospori]MBE1603755.1 hypothetical protein [Actinopolymorpha pittospori]